MNFGQEYVKQMMIDEIKTIYFAWQLFITTFAKISSPYYVGREFLIENVVYCIHT